MLANIITWIVVGALAGWIASMIMKTNAEQGGLANVVVGIDGAIIGGAISSALGGPGFDGFNLTSLLIAIVGAVILLFFVRMFKHRGSAA